MSDEKVFTYDEVKEHNTKKVGLDTSRQIHKRTFHSSRCAQDLYMVIHDKVYSCASFVDEHP
jgi:cytochrome b involved in lipid metabolism